MLPSPPRSLGMHDFSYSHCPQRASSPCYANHRESPAPPLMQGQLRERACPVHNHRLSSGLSPTAGSADHSTGVGGGGWSTMGTVTAIMVSGRHRLLKPTPPSHAASLKSSVPGGFFYLSIHSSTHTYIHHPYIHPFILPSTDTTWVGNLQRASVGILHEITSH